MTTAVAFRTYSVLILGAGTDTLDHAELGHPKGVFVD